jgi:hypothetical protein
MSLPDKYVEEICKLGKGKKTCAFLLVGEGFDCAKSLPAFRKTIENRLAENSMNAKGNNCPGKNPHVCKEGFNLCQNADIIEGIDVCAVCFEGDIANCKFDPPHENMTNCISRCINSNGPCPEGETLYEKKGLQFDKFESI